MSPIAIHIVTHQLLTNWQRLITIPCRNRLVSESLTVSRIFFIRTESQNGHSGSQTPTFDSLAKISQIQHWL